MWRKAVDRFMLWKVRPGLIYSHPPLEILSANDGKNSLEIFFWIFLIFSFLNSSLSKMVLGLIYSHLQPEILSAEEADKIVGGMIVSPILFNTLGIRFNGFWIVCFERWSLALIYSSLFPAPLPMSKHCTKKQDTSPSKSSPPLVNNFRLKMP